MSPRALVVFAPQRVSRDFIDYPYFADLGAIQAAAVLRDAGFDVALSDALAQPGATLGELGAGDVLLGRPLEPFLDELPADFDCAVVALTPFHRPPAADPFLARTLARLRALRPGAAIVLADLYQSGQHVVDAPGAELLASYPDADALLKYEPEVSLPPLLRALVAERAAGSAPRRRAERGVAPERLDALPLPAWDLVDLDAMWAFHAETVRRLGRPRWAFPITDHSVPVVTSRGCPFRCVHCSSNPDAREAGELVRPKVQRRCSPERVAALLDHLAARGARRIHLLDELVNVNLAHWEAVLDALVARGLSFEIPNGMRADYLHRAHIERMKGATTTLSVSAESGVQRVLDEIVDKQLDLADIERVARDASEVGVPLLVHFMIGLPGETKPEINATLGFASRLAEAWGVEPSVQFATPLPGTALARVAAERGRVLPVVSDWGPLFQQAPSIETADVTRDELARFKWTFDLRREASRGPKRVVMSVTYKCNNRCTFCATGTRAQFDGDYRRQRELLVEHRRRGARLLDLDGGEPTLNPNLWGLVRFARRIGYERITVTTNGRMAAYPEVAERLVRCGVTSVLVSIHGPDARTHGENVGVAEAFDQTMQGARNLLRLAPPEVELGACVTVTESNHDRMLELARLLYDTGFRRLDVQFLTPFGRGTRRVAPDTAAAAERVMRVIDEMGDRGRLADPRPDPMRIRVVNLPFCFMPGYEAHVTGDLLELEGQVRYVNDDHVALFEYLRGLRAKKPVCAGCPHAVFCGGFYELDDVPEPTWLVRPDDLVRRRDEASPSP